MMNCSKIFVDDFDLEPQDEYYENDERGYYETIYDNLDKELQEQGQEE